MEHYGHGWTRLGTIGVLLILLAALAYPDVTRAGGVAVTFDQPLGEVQAGVAFTVGFTIRSAHEDRLPQPALTPIIFATHTASRDQATAEATEEGAPGHYVLTLTLPATGTWSWELAPFGTQDPGYRLTLPGPLKVVAPGAQAPSNAPAATALQDVKAEDSVYDPSEQHVLAGTTIVWHNTGKLPHTVTAVNGLFSSGNLAPGGEYRFTFEEPGTYVYYCEYHAPKPASGAADGVIPVNLRKGGGGHMVGTIVVTASVTTGGVDATTAGPPDPKPSSPVLLQGASQAGGAAAEQVPTLPITGISATSTWLLVLIALGVGAMGRLIRRRARS